MDPLLMAGIFGFIGGAARACVGVLKSLRKRRKFNLKYFLASLLAAGIIGVFTGLLYDSSYKLSLIAGYAGTDIIESLVKIRNPKNSLFS